MAIALSLVAIYAAFSKLPLAGRNRRKINPDKSHSQGYPGNAFHYFTNLSGGKKMGPYAVEGILNV